MVVLADNWECRLKRFNRRTDRITVNRVFGDSFRYPKAARSHALLKITEDEDRLTASLLEAKRARAKSIAELLSGWEQLVGEIERGYRLTVYDYTNDLGTRDLLNYLCRNVPTELCQRIEAVLEKADDRFRGATVEFPRGVLARSADPDRWWYFRKPTIMAGELKEDFLELESLDDHTH
jgi:hypothetical protein